MRFKAKPHVIFYEKTQCAGNARQKSLLKEQGVAFEVRSMLDTIWSSERLNPFFEGLEVCDMFNPFAPAVKNRKINIEKLSKQEAVELMVKEPILIKRPLIQINERFFCGFDIGTLNKALNIQMPTPENINVCTSSESCKRV
jgi:nitrogenase-associated protein